MSLTSKEILEILEKVGESGCEEFHFHVGDVALTLRRGSSAKAIPKAFVDTKEANISTKNIANESHLDSPPRGSKSIKPASDNGIGVKAPISGTFFRRPAPDQSPFVEEGDQIAAGDPVCVIEVMKLFSTVYAEQSGRVVAVAVADGTPVEKEQLLFSIEPTE